MIDAEPQRIEHVNIKGKVVVRLDDGSVVNASLKRYREFARPACLYCRDYAADWCDQLYAGREIFEAYNKGLSLSPTSEFPWLVNVGSSTTADRIAVHNQRITTARRGP